MKRSISVVLTAVLMIILTACASDSAGEKINKSFKAMEGYTASVKVTVTGSKDTEVYELRQSWKRPDCYRTEVIKPEELCGTVSIRNGDTLYFQGADEPGIQMEYNVTDEGKDFLFLSDFLEEYYAGEVLPELIPDENNLVLLKGARQGTHESRFTQNLWINAENGLPEYLVTYDVKGDEVLRVEFEEFSLNPNFPDSAFLPEDLPADVS